MANIQIPTHFIRTAEQKAAEALDEAWASLRAERDARIAATDWTQLPDAPCDPLTWQAYRQALRDLPDNTTDPHNPEWPEKPQ